MRKNNFANSVRSGDWTTELEIIAHNVSEEYSHYTGKIFSLVLLEGNQFTVDVENKYLVMDNK